MCHPSEGDIERERGIKTTSAFYISPHGSELHKDGRDAVEPVDERQWASNAETESKCSVVETLLVREMERWWEEEEGESKAVSKRGGSSIVELARVLFQSV